MIQKIIILLAMNQIALLVNFLALHFTLPSHILKNDKNYFPMIT